MSFHKSGALLNIYDYLRDIHTAKAYEQTTDKLQMDR